MTLRFGGLWRHPDFMKLWTGQTVSQFGSGVTREAIPMTALLALGATPIQMGALAAIASAPVILFGMFAGVWVDRVRRRPVMVWSDLLRALLLLTIPAAALANMLTIEVLFVVAPLVGLLTVMFDVAYQSYIPSLVRREQLVEANSKLTVSGSLAEVTAPGIAGVLVQLITGPIAILVDAISFLCSALALGTIRAREPIPKPEEDDAGGVLREMVAGVRALFGDAILRAFALHATMSHFFGNFYATLYGLYVLRVLELSPIALGLIVAAGGIGNLLGALIAERSTSRFGVGGAVLVMATLSSATSLVIPLAGGPAVVAAGVLIFGQIIGDGADSVFDIGAKSIRQAITPDAVLGRVNGGMYLLSAGVGPLGALLAGVLAEVIGIRPTIWIAIGGGMLGLLWLYASPLRRLRTLGPE